MSRPDESPDTSGTPEPSAPTPPEGKGDWADTRSSLQDLFKSSAGEETLPDVEVPREAAAFDLPPEPDAAPSPSTAAPPPSPAPVQASEAALDVKAPAAAPAEESPLPPATDSESPAPPASSVPAAPAAPHTTVTGVSNDLEELILTSTAPGSGPQVGSEVDGYRLNEDLGRGWFIASPLDSGPSQEVYVRPDPLWALLLPHRLLPKTRQVGQLRVLEPTQGPALQPPVPAAEVLRHLGDLARLLFALEKQGYAVVDLDPSSPRLTPEGLKLRFPPRVAHLGDTSPAVLREGFTPPEVLAGQSVDARAGVYLLGALAYGWLSGQPLPPEGASPILLGGIATPGLPQLLQQMLAPVGQRLTPSELLTALKARTSPALPAYQVAAATSVGLNPDRPTNEDSYGFTWHQVDADGFPELRLRACVSDGMGGMAAGEVASRAAVNAFLNSTQSTLTGMVWDANAAVLRDMQGRDGGCTISGVEISGTQLQLGHVGDCRAYLLQGGEVHKISKDHSYVAAMVASGQMTQEEADHSPDRNKVLRSLGSLRVPQDNYVHTLPEVAELHVGDRVLIVTDGVWGEVPDADLRTLLKSQAALQPLVDDLIQRALNAGAPDNATALVIERVK